MLKQLQKKKEEGFTIIEVMIVLAIAGLIILVVLLAVPALQRNSRNTQRSSDAASVAAAVNECLSNRNGQITSCDTLAEIPLDTTKLRQLTAVSYGTGMPGNTESVRWSFGIKCATDGASSVSGATRQFAVLYNSENTSGGNVPRCVEG